MSRDHRDAEDNAAWNRGKFTEEEAAEAGRDQAEMNAERDRAERELGNPLAPPE